MIARPQATSRLRSRLHQPGPGLITGAAEAAGWPGTLSARLRRGEGRGFYSVIFTATVGGLMPCFTPVDPVKELFGSAVLNGVIAVPITATMALTVAALLFTL